MTQDVNRNDLVNRLEGFVRRLSLQDWSGIPDADAFVDIHKEILAELQRSPAIYKVCNIDTTSEKRKGFVEYDTQYFSSLSAAQKELCTRLHELRRSPFLATPDEILESGLVEGIRPQNCRSIITNNDLEALPPNARFKFFELRMKTEEGVTPIQLLMTRVKVEEPALESKKHPVIQAKLIQFPICRRVLDEMSGSLDVHGFKKL